MKNQARNELAYKETEQHRGLTNKIGENNCFLNVTIQALWHLGPFRVHLQQLIAILESHKENPSIHQKKSLLVALCNLFVQYEFADQDMLPPNELRESLSTLSAEYELGKIADATETLETILQNIHEEFESICPSRIKCLAHSTFGGIILEQSRCHLCGASSEPTIRNNYLMYFQSTEMLANMQEIQPPIPLIQMRKTDAEKFSQPRKISSFFNLASFLSSNQSHNSRFSRELAKSSKKDFESLLEKQLLQSKQFGCILKKCLLSVGKRSCPSFGDASGTKSSSGANFEADSKGNENRSNPFQGKDSGSKSHYEKEFKDFKRSTSCLGQASVSLHSLDAPLILALSIGWSESKETKENLLKFFSMISSLIHLEDLFSEGGKLPLSPKHSFRASSKKFSTSKGQKSSVEDCSPAYVFRGMVCYYGKHYVSIFLDSVSSGEESYLLFDDHRVRPIGSWSDAVQFCASSCYQPVLLLYELEKNSIVFTLDKIQQDYSSFSLLDSQHTEGVTTQEAGDRSTTVLTDSSLIREPENDASYLELNYGKTELEEDEKDQENEDNESLQIMSMDTVDDLESKDTTEFILPDIQSGANIRDPLIVTGSKLNLSPENIDDENTVVHSINANRNILPDDVSALESPSIKSIRRRFPFLQAKFDPDLDIYTNDGRHKSFWSRYYDARYRIDSNGVKVESNYSHRFHRHDQGREFNPHCEQIHRINGQFESNYFSHDGKSGGSITSVGFSEFLPENEFMDPYIHLESNYNLNHDFTSEPPIPASPKFLKYQVQSLIEIWGRRPYRYHISLPVLFNEVASVGASFRGTRTFPQVMLGIILDANEREEVFVTGFYKHPVTQKEFPAELSGKINLMDQLLAVNGEFISSLSVSPSTANNNRQDSYFAPDPASKKLLAIHKLISTLHEPFIILEFQSAVCSILWYQCPNCSFTNDIFPDREDSLKKQLMKRIQKRKIKKNDNSNTHSIQNYGIYFRCKFCNVKSLCKDYLPDLSEY